MTENTGTQVCKGKNRMIRFPGKKAEELIVQKNISDYETFINENRKRINEQFNVVLRVCILAGPLIALAVKFGVFKGVTYGTAVFISAFLLVVTIVHKLLLKKYASSLVTSLISLFAIDVLLIVMDSAHLTIYITWFLIPLLSIQFCDLRLYTLSVGVNYGCMVFATWHMAPYFTERRLDVETPFAYFASRLGGLTVETIMMVFAGFTLCKMISRYYRELIENNRTIQDQELQKEKAMAASEAKSLFLSNMSHEIRTPINTVLGMNEMVLRESDDDNIVSYSESIKIAGGMLLGLINDILDFSKIEAGKMEIIPVDYDLSSVVNDLVNMVQARADEKGLALELEFDSGIPKFLNGDDVRFKQVITNILTNAVKYTEKGTVTFSIGYERIESEPDSVLLNVSVKDTGIGIKEEDMHKLFSEFERIEEERNRNVEGTGLGMSITRKLLEMMGSTLRVESDYGHGSHFYFSLRQKVVKWDPLGDYESSYHALVAGREKYREKFTAPEAVILVVDDNPMNLVVFKSLLKQTRMRIETADSGEEGILLTQDKKYDMIFLDHMMPGKDGIETLKEIRSQAKNLNLTTPMVCLTANAISGAREQYIEAGFDDYLTKPIDSAQLEGMLMARLPEELIEKTAVTENGREDDEEIPEILKLLNGSPIDAKHGLKNSGTLEDYMNLLKIFFESLPGNISEIERLYNEKDLKNYTIKVHALKSSARIIGAIQFGEKAQELENAGKKDDVIFIREHHGLFISDSRSFEEPLAKLFEQVSGRDADDKPEADMSLMESVYAELLGAAEKMDCDMLEGIFEEMEGYRIPETEEGLFSSLKESAMRYDYDAIVLQLKDK